MESPIFSNDWWTAVWNTYNMSILGFPLLIAFIVKLLAIFNPNIPSDQIIDVFKQYWPQKK